MGHLLWEAAQQRLRGKQIKWVEVLLKYLRPSLSARQQPEEEFFNKYDKYIKKQVKTAKEDYTRDQMRDSETKKTTKKKKHKI